MTSNDLCSSSIYTHSFQGQIFGIKNSQGYDKSTVKIRYDTKHNNPRRMLEMKKPCQVHMPKIFEKASAIVLKRYGKINVSSWGTQYINKMFWTEAVGH